VKEKKGRLDRVQEAEINRGLPSHSPVRRLQGVRTWFGARPEYGTMTAGARGDTKGICV